MTQLLLSLWRVNIYYRIITASGVNTEAAGARSWQTDRQLIQKTKICGVYPRILKETK